MVFYLPTMEKNSLITERHPLLNNKLLKLLNQNNINSVFEFLQEDLGKISTITKLNLNDIFSIRADFFKKYSAPLVNGSCILFNRINRRFISTGLKSLDQIISGIPIGYITELCGLAGTGKTQLCLQLAINSVKNSDDNILYIDTKGDFSAVRLQKVLDSCGYTHKEMALIMIKIKVVHVWCMDNLVKLFTDIKNNLIKIDRLCLIIIDSLPCLMLQHLGDQRKTGLALLNSFVSLSRYLCKELNISVICVNIQTRWIENDITDIDDDGDAKETNKVEKKHRCLGNYWQHIPALVLLLQKTQDKLDDRCFVNVTVHKSIYSKCNLSCQLSISDVGVT